MGGHKVSKHNDDQTLLKEVFLSCIWVLRATHACLQRIPNILTCDDQTMRHYLPSPLVGTVRTSSELLHIVSRPPFSFPASRPGPSARNKPTFLNLPIEVDSSGILRRKNLFLFFLFVCLANIVLFQTPTTHYKGRQVSLAKEASGRPLESHRALQDDG